MTCEYDPTEKEMETSVNNFTYHPPKGTQAQRYEEIRGAAAQLSDMFLRECPPSRERSLAITKLEEAVMWANASIARNE